ncbi:MAG: hypothetical protein AAF298_14735 [Cyanobacteria bacterium P01_A01_bin.40]
MPEIISTWLNNIGKVDSSDRIWSGSILNFLTWWVLSELLI